MTKPCLPGLFAEPESTFREKKAVNVPRTSVLAYQERNRTGRVDYVLQAITHLTAAATSAELCSQSFGDTRTDGLLYIRRGLSDALALGLVEHAGQRVCRVSGRTCITWRLRQR